MNKRILITSTDLMMIQFLVPHVRNLVENGFEVELACSNVGGRLNEVRETLGECVQAVHEVGLVRSPVSVKNMSGYKDMKNVLSKGSYDIIWTNEPVMGVATRLAARTARKKGTKVIYMVHGFHFYKGAPLLNWLIFYPIEKLMAYQADMIVTVNQEDYQRAKKMNVKEVRYIHGIGINTDRLNVSSQQTDIREELDLNEDDFIVLSVGELNRNKNQKVIIQALEKLNDSKIHYLLCGKGNQLENLQKLAKNLKVEEKVHFLGYRKDVVNICSQSNLYVMPSKREGLPVATLEAMYCGLPVVTSNIRGLVDVVQNGKSGYLCNPKDVQMFSEMILNIKKDNESRMKMSTYNQSAVQPYCVFKTKNEILDIMMYLGGCETSSLIFHGK